VQVRINVNGSHTGNGAAGTVPVPLPMPPAGTVPMPPAGTVPGVDTVPAPPAVSNVSVTAAELPELTVTDLDNILTANDGRVTKCPIMGQAVTDMCATPFYSRLNGLLVDKLPAQLFPALISLQVGELLIEGARGAIKNYVDTVKPTKAEWQNTVQYPFRLIGLAHWVHKMTGRLQKNGKITLAVLENVEFRDLDAIDIVRTGYVETFNMEKSNMSPNCLQLYKDLSGQVKNIDKRFKNRKTSA
jgi:hypothetical protein